MTVGLAVLSALASAVTLYLFLERLKDRRQFGWKHVERLVKKLLSDIQRQDYKPDIVLGVGRGGAILAGMLAGNLGHLPLAVVDTVLDRSSSINTATVRFPECCPSLRDKEILLVVGELYSGEDLRAGMEFAKERLPRGIKTASLLTHPAASVRPDFVGIETERPLTAPWRITDIYKTRRF